MWREGFFTGDPEGYVKAGFGKGHPSPQGPHWRTREGMFFTGDFERQDFDLSGDLVY